MTEHAQSVRLTRAEAQILADVVGMILADPDWQELATASDAEWDAFQRAYIKIAAVAR